MGQRAFGPELCYLGRAFEDSASSGTEAQNRAAFNLEMAAVWRQEVGLGLLGSLTGVC